jgi:small subunit ribosomal protein S1
MPSEAATDTPPPERAPRGASDDGAKKKRRGSRSGNRGGGGNGSSGGGKGRSRRPSGPRLDLSPPRFDPTELAILSGPPLWQAVHAATVLDVTDAAVFVEVRPAGHDSVRAAIPPNDFEGVVPEQGQELHVRLLDPPRGAGDAAAVATASARQALELVGLDRLVQSAHEGEPIPGVVIGEVKGGYAVAVGAESETDLDRPGILRGFLPKSQASHSRAPDRTVLGTVDQFDITELEVERANIVVSRKARLAAEARRLAAQTWDTIAEGQTVRARVRALVPYGAFLDVNGVDGLMHMSDLSWEHKPKVSDVLKPGQELDVMVLVADKSKKRLKLGLKQILPDPWRDAREKLAPGAEVEGDVVAVADFGAFVKLDEGVEGLVHLSEISWERVKHPSQRFKIGQRVKAKVLDADFQARRISLSTKALEQNPFQTVLKKYPEGARATGKVRSLTDFGAFVEIEEGVEGLVHIGELSWTDRVNHPSEVLTIGQEVEVVVMMVDVSRQRISCSIKRLTDNPWETAEKKFSRGSRHKLPVVRVMDRGAYVQLADDLQGFVPLRELSADPVQRAQDIVKMGQELELEVKTFDRRTRKVTLSARAVSEGDTKRAYDDYKKSQGRSDRMTLGDALGGALAGLRAKVGDTDDDKS